MISDELRELLSAYVDGELPHGEAARVEESAKRDPRLRRHINSYRRLSETLRIWDIEEHAHPPSASVKERALARVRSYESERRHEVGFAPPVWWQRPAVIAAGTLLALGLGILAALPQGRTEATATLARADGIEWGASRIAGDYRTAVEAEPFEPFAFDPPAWPADAFEQIIRYDTVGIPFEVDGEIIYFRNRRTLEAAEYIRNGIRDDFRRSPERPKIRETRTGTQPNAFLVSVMKGYEPHTTGFKRLVALRHELDAASVPASRPAPDRTTEGSSFVQGGELSNEQHYLRVAKPGSLPVLTLAGELWVEPIGKSERVGISRVVTATTWVKSGELVRMAWSSDKRPDPKANQFALRAESLVLGPKARRMLLGRNGFDAELLTTLTGIYGARGPVEAGRAGAKTNRAAVQKMVAALEADRAATGFAVYGDDGRLLGTEIFATHALMAQFAPRLLHGYLVEAGGRVRLKPANGGAPKAIAQVRAFLNHELPRNAQRVEEVRTWKDAEDWPEGMRQVNLVSPTREVVGHGLFVGDVPVHLTLFGG